VLNGRNGVDLTGVHRRHDLANSGPIIGVLCDLGEKHLAGGLRIVQGVVTTNANAVVHGQGRQVSPTGIGRSRLHRDVVGDDVDYLEFVELQAVVVHMLLHHRLVAALEHIDVKV